MNADLKKPDSGAPAKKARPTHLDLQVIFSWLLADGIVEKDKVKAQFAQAQGILKNAVGSMHPLSAVAQCKLRMGRRQGQPAVHPHRPAQDRLYQGGRRDVSQLRGAL